MECRLKARMKEMVLELALEQQQALAAAGTLADLEELTCEIGDEFSRMLTEHELSRRCQQHADAVADCPDCGRSCQPDAAPDPVLLIGLRGTLSYAQPKHHCNRCRRSFFPAGRAIGSSRAWHGDDEGVGESDLGRDQ